MQPRQWLWDLLHPFPPLKAFGPWLPEHVWLRMADAGMAMKFDEQGNILRFMTDLSGGTLKKVTSAREIGASSCLHSVRETLSFATVPLDD